jgi:hypothetical protein
MHTKYYIIIIIIRGLQYNMWTARPLLLSRLLLLLLFILINGSTTVLLNSCPAATQK